jgi:hypothetical protein
MLHTWNHRQRHTTCNRTERFSSLFWHSELQTKSYWKRFCCLVPHIKRIKSITITVGGFQTLSNWRAVESQNGERSHSGEDGSRFATERISHLVRNDSRLLYKEATTGLYPQPRLRKSANSYRIFLRSVLILFSELWLLKTSEFPFLPARCLIMHREIFRLLPALALKRRGKYLDLTG